MHIVSKAMVHETIKMKVFENRRLPWNPMFIVIFSYFLLFSPSELLISGSRSMGGHENPSKSQVLIDHWQIQTIGAIPERITPHFTEKSLKMSGLYHSKIFKMSYDLYWNRCFLRLCLWRIAPFFFERDRLEGASRIVPGCGTPLFAPSAGARGLRCSDNGVEPWRLFHEQKSWNLWWIWGWVKTLVPPVNPKIAGLKWMFIPLKMVLIGIDPYPYVARNLGMVCMWAEVISSCWLRFDHGWHFSTTHLVSICSKSNFEIPCFSGRQSFSTPTLLKYVQCCSYVDICN